MVINHLLSQMSLEVDPVRYLQKIEAVCMSVIKYTHDRLGLVKTHGYLEVEVVRNLIVTGMAKIEIISTLW